LGERLRRVDDLNEVKHGGTEATETHGGSWRGLNRYRETAVKARAQEVSGETIAAAIEVHRQLGPGLLESVYRACLSQELRLRGIDQLGLLVNFNSDLLKRGLRRVLDG
jgi:hypothetical protein